MTTLVISNAVIARLYHRPFATENDSVVSAEQSLFEVINHARNACFRVLGRLTRGRTADGQPAVDQNRGAALPEL